MRSAIEGMGGTGEGDPMLTYLHHVSIAFNGPTRADDIFEEMEQRVIGQTASLKFLDALATYAEDYVAICTPSAGKWGPYDTRVPRYVDNISQEIKMPFIRPLMLSIAAKFNPSETMHAFRLLSSWVVRFLVSSGSRSGVVEKSFREAAHSITERKITTASELAAAVITVIPSDNRFQVLFAKRRLRTVAKRGFCCAAGSAEKNRQAR